MTPIVRWAQVDNDLRQAIAYYREHSGTEAPRDAHELDLPGVRSRCCTGTPYPVLYAERTDVIDVWRGLHEHRDIPQSLQASDSPKHALDRAG